MEWILTSSLKSKTKSFIKNSNTEISTKLSTEPLKKLNNAIIQYLFAFYKVGLHPHLGNACKFHPSCSAYAKESFENHNVFKAFGLTVMRLLRCHPFTRGGFDPIPAKKEVRHG